MESALFPAPALQSGPPAAPPIDSVTSELGQGDSDKILAELAVQYVGREWEARLSSTQLARIVDRGFGFGVVSSGLRFRPKVR